MLWMSNMLCHTHHWMALSFSVPLALMTMQTILFMGTPLALAQTKQAGLHNRQAVYLSNYYSNNLITGEWFAFFALPLTCSAHLSIARSWGELLYLLLILSSWSHCLFCQKKPMFKLGVMSLKHGLVWIFSKALPKRVGHTTVKQFLNIAALLALPEIQHQPGSVSCISAQRLSEGQVEHTKECMVKKVSEVYPPLAYLNNMVRNVNEYLLETGQVKERNLCYSNPFLTWPCKQPCILWA